MMALHDPQDSRGNDTRVLLMFRLDGVRLVNETNAREHWAARSKRARAQRAAAKLATMSALRKTAGYWRGMPDTMRATITITRSGPRKLDSDNLAASAKHVRDGVADALGVDDGSDRLDWKYDQCRGSYGVAITVRFEA